MSNVVGNRDRCGRCGARHGGNNHLCPVHGTVSEGCCHPRCNREEWVWYQGIGAVRADQPAPSGDWQQDATNPRHYVLAKTWNDAPAAEYQLNVRVPLEAIQHARTIQGVTHESQPSLIRRLLREESARLAVAVPPVGEAANERT